MDATKKVVKLNDFVLNMPVNKKENGEYKLIGNVSVPMFALDAFGLNATVSDNDDDGLPVYADPKIQFVQDAVTAAIKAIARNKLVSGTNVTKAGSKIASTVSELLESGGNSAAALQLHRDFVNDFVTYLTTSGKSKAAQSLYSGLVKAKASIALSTDARRQGLMVQLENFIASRNEADQAKYLAIVENLATLCENAEDLDDSDL